MRDRVRDAVSAVLGPPSQSDHSLNWRVLREGHEPLSVLMSNANPYGPLVVMIFNPGAAPGNQVNDFLIRDERAIPTLVDAIRSLTSIPHPGANPPKPSGASA